MTTATIRKSTWNTYAMSGYTHDVANDQACWGCLEADKASRWEDLDLEEIQEIAYQLVQTRQPIEVRLRDSADDDWSNEQLVGFRLGEGEYGTGVIYFVDANGGEWIYCQIYRQVSA